MNLFVLITEIPDCSCATSVQRTWNDVPRWLATWKHLTADIRTEHADDYIRIQISQCCSILKWHLTRYRFTSA